MSSHRLSRLSGISLLVGSVLLLIGSLNGFFGHENPASLISTTSSQLRLAGGMLMALGLPGMYAKLTGHTGTLGLLGFACTFLFLFMVAAFEPIIAFVFPALLAHGFTPDTFPLPAGLFIYIVVASLLGLTGGILLGISILRTTALPRWAGVLLLVGIPLFSIAGTLDSDLFRSTGVTLYTIGFSWIALWMMSKQRAAVEATLPPTGVRA